MGVGGRCHDPAALHPGKRPRYALYTRLSGPQSRSTRGGKISTPPRFDPRTVRSVKSRYIDYAMTDLNYCVILYNIWAGIATRYGLDGPEIESR